MEMLQNFWVRFSPMLIYFQCFELGQLFFLAKFFDLIKLMLYRFLRVLIENLRNIFVNQDLRWCYIQLPLVTVD